MLIMRFFIKVSPILALSTTGIGVSSYTPAGAIRSKGVCTIDSKARSLSMNNCNNSNTYKSMYGIEHSGWTSPQWNWGSAIGTGHDCARICRQNYSARALRQELVSSLLNAQGTIDDLPTNFEEIKLTLALVWQRGRWDGSDGGKGGYGEILHYLVLADRYEDINEIVWSHRWIEDLMARFHLLRPSTDQISTMENLMDNVRSFTSSPDSDDSIIFRARRQCSGLVLQAIGFIENGC
jgi:hypothetical protein